MQAPGLDLGYFEDVVDEGEEVLAALVDGSKIVALVVGNAVIPCHELGETEDGIERRAQLVAHVGKEDTLGTIGGFGGVDGLAQGILHALPAGDFMGQAAVPVEEGEQHQQCDGKDLPDQRVVDARPKLDRPPFLGDGIALFQRHGGDALVDEPGQHRPVLAHCHRLPIGRRKASGRRRIRLCRRCSLIR